MKKLFTLVAMAIMAVGANAQTEWNFSNWEDQTIASTTTVEGLTITVDKEDHALTVETLTDSETGEAKPITIGETSYAKRLKTGGSGRLLDSKGTKVSAYRALSFAVTGKCTISVALKSSSSSSDRTLQISTLDTENVKETKLATLTAAGASASVQTYEYTGDATTLYLYPNAGIYIYDIKVTPEGTTGINELTAAEANVNAPVYNLAGQRVSKDAKGILIQNGKKFINK